MQYSCDKRSKRVRNACVSPFAYEHIVALFGKRTVLASRDLLCIGWLALWLFPAVTACAEVCLFDMGTAKSELRPGFTRITRQSIYRKSTGFGWKTDTGLREQSQHYSREWQYSESRGRKQPPPLYTNEITCDTIFSDQPNAFLLDLEPGDYTVHLLSGLSSGSTRDYHDFDITVGKATATVRIPGRYQNSAIKIARMALPCLPGITQKLSIPTQYLGRMSWIRSCALSRRSVNTNR